MAAEIRFFVAGTPKTTQTGSVIKAGGRSFPVKRNTPWSAVCGLVARENAPERPLDGPVAAALTFIMPRPKNAKGRIYPTVRPDIDGLCKGLLDSWNGVLWQDDSQVALLTLRKEYATAGDSRGPGVLVEVCSL